MCLKQHTKEGFHVRVYKIVNVVWIAYFHLGLLRVINLEPFHGKSTSTMTSIETLNSHVQKTSNEYDILFQNHEMLHDLFRMHYMALELVEEDLSVRQAAKGSNEDAKQLYNSIY